VLVTGRVVPLARPTRSLRTNASAAHLGVRETAIHDQGAKRGHLFEGEKAMNSVDKNVKIERRFVLKHGGNGGRDGVSHAHVARRRVRAGEDRRDHRATGSAAVAGNDSAAAMKLAAEEVNKAGGVLGRQITLVVKTRGGRNPVSKLPTSSPTSTMSPHASVPTRADRVPVGQVLNGRVSSGSDATTNELEAVGPYSSTPQAMPAGSRAGRFRES
jgi:hypothetical protein